MHLERRALYNSLRLNWVINPALKTEPWKVEDYRSLSLDLIFDRLRELGFYLDKVSFLALADSVDSPEEFTDELIADNDDDGFSEDHDKVYLLIFELWRRLKQEKPCLSIFCDELDHVIHAYDNGNEQVIELIQDALANLEVILDENVDQGVKPKEAFQIVSAGCAHNIETFLYDFISEQIDLGNESYAAELIEAFSPYVSEAKPFEFLHARILSFTDSTAANEQIAALLKADKKPDLDFYFELLSFMVQDGREDLFQQLVKKMIPLLTSEEDFHDLLSLCADFFHRLDRDETELAIQQLANERAGIPAGRAILPKDPACVKLLKLL